METATNAKQHVHFLYEQIAGIARITFNRPDRLNSLTFEVYAELRDTFAALNRDDSVRAVIITGQGRGFAPAATSKRSSDSFSRGAARG